MNARVNSIRTRTSPTKTVTPARTTKRGTLPGLVTRGAEAKKVALPSKRLGAPPDPAVCARCGSVYQRKTWRAGDRALATLKPGKAGVAFTVCPACRQAREGEYFGRLTLRGSFATEHEAEIRRRIKNIEARAQFTQPERRVVSIEKSAGAIQILTTSQKLAHRIAREMVKLYGGAAQYSWSDGDGALDATWQLESVERSTGRATTRRRSGS